MVERLTRLPSPRLVSFAVVDLVIFVPLVWWFVVVRGRAASLRTVIPVVVASIAGARLILPRDQQAMLPWLRWLIAPFEVAVIAWVGWQVRDIIRRRRAEPTHAIDGSEVGHDLMADLGVVVRPAFGTGRLARIVMTEIGLLYYGLASWGRRAHVPAGARVVAVDRNDGLLIGIVMAIAVETVALHLFISSRWALGAWLLTGTSIYSLFWLVGDARARALRPPYVTVDAIVVRNGMRADATVSRSLVSHVERVTWRSLPAKAPDYLNLTRPAEPNLVVHFIEPVEMQLLFGRRRRVSRLGLRALHPDEVTALLLPVER